MMMRSPEQDRKIAMLGRLPEVARILRTFFVTMKKPAVPFDDAVMKVSDSYRSFMGKCKSKNLPVSIFHTIRFGKYVGLKEVGRFWKNNSLIKVIFNCKWVGHSKNKDVEDWNPCIYRKALTFKRLKHNITILDIAVTLRFLQ